MSTSTQKLVVYWLGYDNNGVKLQDLPAGIDVINLFEVNLNPDTGLKPGYISSDGMSWENILDQAHAVQAKGVKVVASLMSTPNPPISWNTITDAALFAQQVNDLVVNQWGLDGIDIDPEMADAPDQNFMNVVEALGGYFGPASGTGKIMSYVSYVFGNDEALLKANMSRFDYVMLMGYFWDYNEMIEQFLQYAEVTGNNKLLFGISAAAKPAITPLGETIKLAEWQPPHIDLSGKGGMMEFNINYDTDFKYAKAIMKAIK